MNKEEFLGKRYAIDLKLKELNGEMDIINALYLKWVKSVMLEYTD